MTPVLSAGPTAASTPCLNASTELRVWPAIRWLNTASARKGKSSAATKTTYANRNGWTSDDFPLAPVLGDDQVGSRQDAGTEHRRCAAGQAMSWQEIAEQQAKEAEERLADAMKIATNANRVYQADKTRLNRISLKAAVRLVKESKAQAEEWVL